MIVQPVQTVGSVTLLGDPALRLHHRVDPNLIDHDIIAIRDARRQDVVCVSIPVHDDDWWVVYPDSLIDAVLIARGELIGS